MVDYAFTFNGYTLGGVGAAVQVLQTTGLEDTPPMRVANEARGFADGTFYGRDFLSGRTVTIDYLVQSNPSQTFRQIMEAFKAATTPQSGGSTAAGVLTFTLPGIASRRVFCRLRRRSLPVDVDYSYNFGKGSLEFYSADPRIYDEAASSLSIGLSGAQGGLTFPLTFNATFGTVAAPNTQVAVNAGTYNTKPVITIVGPVDTPTIQNVTQGSTLKMNLILAAGDTLTLDTDTRAVVLNGTASRRSSLSTSSVWFDLSPGSNTLIFTAAAPTAATAVLSWRNAYL